MDEVRGPEDTIVDMELPSRMAAVVVEIEDVMPEPVSLGFDLGEFLTE